MVKNNSSIKPKQTVSDDQSIDWAFFIKKGIALTLILGAIVSVVFVVYLAGMFVIFGSDNPVARFIDEHEDMSAFLSLILIISATLWIVTKLSKKSNGTKA